MGKQDATALNPASNEAASKKMMFILMLGILAPLFDTTITNVAIDTLVREFNTTVSTIQWVITSYLLALGMVIPITGWAVERFGGKPMWLFSLLVFLLGSVLCGFAWNIESLIVFRIIQGIGGGLLMPIMQTMGVRASNGQKMGKSMAAVSLPALLGPILGPVLGGLIINHLNWRWIFFVNVPLCVVAIVMAWRGLPHEKSEGKTLRLDLLGLLMLSPAVVLIIYGLGEVSSSHGFGHAAVLIPVAAGLALLAGFIVYALKKGDKALLDIKLFRVRSFTVSSALLFLSGLTTYGAMLLMPLYFQQIRGESVLISGLLLVPQGIGMLLTRSLAGKLTDGIGSRPVVLAGTLLTILGTLPFTQVGSDTSYFYLCAALIVRGAGLGAVFMPVMASAYVGLSPKHIPHASSTTRIMQQIGGAFGASVIAIILQNELDSVMTHDAAAAAVAFDHTFKWSIALSALALIPAAMLPRVKKENR
ncbi:multidrug efflux MFS transporter [Paenibacillus pasadenensis]|uniref:MDR family MFS transporter n=1 Tax=Paenibacillus pasadenensis TaxID=217090 RepID=UPI002041E1FE|nr:MDR family MFS transporter [Paenibacillus pasadenensis]MCM3747197.1 multidrug efflux MFS transporter [Paenibacillus pasadenensis]